MLITFVALQILTLRRTEQIRLLTAEQVREKPWKTFLTAWFMKRRPVGWWLRTLNWEGCERKRPLSVEKVLSQSMLGRTGETHGKSQRE
jgi:hypothetical protein